MNRTQLIHAMQTILEASPQLLEEGSSVSDLATEFASDELLILMNADSWPVFVANSSLSIARNVLEAENRVQGSPTILPKVWPKPAFCVGEAITIMGGNDGLVYEQSRETYVDDAGEVFLVDAYSVIIDGETDFTIRQRSNAEGPLRLNRLIDYLPERFSECVEL